MASLPGARFNISGASGSQGLLSPSSSWRCYVFPRGGFASSSSSGTTITFDSTSVASRFAANNWIQVGTDISTIRKVSAVGGNSISVSGAAVTVALNARVLIIGNTQPTTVGGSATYIVPQSQIFQRDDDGSTTFTNSMVTTDDQGLVQFFGGPAVFDCLIQDGNQTIQALIIDLPVGAVEGISTSLPSIFGATVTINAALGVTGWATFGQTVTMNAALGVTGWATFGTSVTLSGPLGVTGTGAFGQTVTLTGTSGNYSHSGTVVFGATVTMTGALGVTGVITAASPIVARWLTLNNGTAHAVSDYTITGWGTGSTLTLLSGETNYDPRFEVGIFTGTTVSVNPSFSFNYKNGPYATIPIHIESIISTGDTRAIALFPGGTSTLLSVVFSGSPVSGVTYFLRGLVLG